MPEADRSRSLKSVVVTGAGAGIGRAIAESLALTGWHVLGVDNDAETAGELKTWLGARGATLVGDVAQRSVLDRAANQAATAAPLRAWVNNAALSVQTSLTRPDAGLIDRILAVNIGGVLWGCAAAVRTFAKQRLPGAIVNLSSVHGRAGFAGWAAYDTSKGAVEALTRYVAVEYGPVGVRANAVAPGTVRTPNHERHLVAAADPDSLERELSETQPLRRIGEPAEIAAVVRFLLSDEASFITGQTIVADGGLTAACLRNPLHPQVAEAFGLHRANADNDGQDPGVP